MIFAIRKKEVVNEVEVFVVDVDAVLGEALVYLNQIHSSTWNQTLNISKSGNHRHARLRQNASAHSSWAPRCQTSQYG